MAGKISRPLSSTLRVFIAAGSVGAFLGGWALLAHSPNPYETAQAGAADTSAPRVQNNAQLPPLPTPRARGAQNSQSAPQQQTAPQLLPNFQPQQQTQPQSQFGSPFRQRRMRTSGS